MFANTTRLPPRFPCNMPCRPHEFPHVKSEAHRLASVHRRCRVSGVRSASIGCWSFWTPSPRRTCPTMNNCACWSKRNSLPTSYQKRRTRNRPAFCVLGQVPQRFAPIPPIGPRSLVRSGKTRVREEPSRSLSNPEISTSNSRTLWLPPTVELPARFRSDPERNHFELDLLT